MNQKTKNILKKRLDKKNYQKLMKIKNSMVHRFIAKYIELCNPAKVFVCTDSKEDIKYIRESAIRNKEEAKLAIKGHTVHFDGYHDQARDKKRTKFLLSKSVKLGPGINVIERERGTKEINSILKNIMNGHELYVKFFCLGPMNSEFTIPCIQLTDSCYVSHSEDLLYRQGYKEFIKMDKNDKFFKFVHSQGELEEAGMDLLVSKNIKKRRVYIDLKNEIIYSTNTQYGGNTIGLKKLAMRLAINRASKEGWLTEHMFIMGVHGPGGRVSYFTGAFPSLCGKTSTAMVDDETIIGDDIAFLRRIDGKVRAANTEIGIFGIIQGINPKDDPLMWKTLHESAEIIFSNVLVKKDRNPYWNDMNSKNSYFPKKGVNYSNGWFLGKKDEEGKIIPSSHKNARFTLKLEILDNLDPKLNDPKGVLVSGIIYGGRDSDTWVPVEEAFDWVHGIVSKGASLESETTAATLGKVGLRVFNPMSNLDFLSIPIGKYIEDNLDFGDDLKNPPRVFSVNYFLKDSNGKYMNHKNDKRVWLKWMELRVHDEVDAIKTPTGLIPKYQDLKRLFKETLNKRYCEEDYVEQFTLRIPEHLTKINRLIKIFNKRVHDTPKIVFKILEEQKERLKDAREKYGDYVSPFKLAS